MQTNRIAWETLRSLSAGGGGFTGAYQTVGGPLLFPSYILKVVNTSSVLVTVSIDGATDIDVAPANSFFLYDEGKVGQSAYFPALPAGTQIYIKGTGGGGVNPGSIYVISQYIVIT